MLTILSERPYVGTHFVCVLCPSHYFFLRQKLEKNVKMYFLLSSVNSYKNLQKRPIKEYVIFYRKNSIGQFVWLHIFTFDKTLFICIFIKWLTEHYSKKKTNNLWSYPQSTRHDTMLRRFSINACDANVSRINSFNMKVSYFIEVINQ